MFRYPERNVTHDGFSKDLGTLKLALYPDSDNKLLYTLMGGLVPLVKMQNLNYVINI